MNNGKDNFGIIRELFIVQEGICFLCPEPMTLAVASRRNPHGWTREHVRPKIKGGGGSLTKNIVLAHSPCNGKKGGREPTADEVARCQELYLKIEALRERQGPRLDHEEPQLVAAAAEERRVPLSPKRRIGDERLSDHGTCGCGPGSCRRMFTPGCRESRYCDCITKGVYHRVGAAGCSKSPEVK